MNSLSLSQLIEEILASGKMSNEQETYLFDLIEQRQYLDEDIVLIDKLADAIGSGEVQILDIEHNL